MLTDLRKFLKQPLLISDSFGHQLLTLSKQGTSADVKNLFFDAPCPVMAIERQVAAMSQSASKQKSVLVIPIRGVISQHGSWWTEMMGGCSIDSLNRALDMALNEDRVGSVLFDHHTPGGAPFGVKEFADRVYAARSEKLMVSVSNSLMCSAGCWTGSAADRVFVSPMSQNASVGVFSMLTDETGALEMEGVKVKICRVPEGKAEGHPYEPLTQTVIDNEMTAINAIYTEFTGSLAKYRGVSVQKVKDDFGSGRCMDAKSAVSAGLADRVASFDQVLAMMQAGSVRRQSSGASAVVEAEGPKLDARDPIQLRRQMAILEAAYK